MAFFRIRPRWRETKARLKIPPATEALRVLLPGDEIGNIDIYELEYPFVEYIRRLNQNGGDTRAWRYISTPDSGIFNYTRIADGTIDRDWYENGRKPLLNTVAFDGNIVTSNRVVNGYAVIESIDVNKYVPLYSYWERPDLVHQFSSVNDRGRLYKGGNAVRAFSPLLTRFRSVLPLELLEPFPRLPTKVTIESADGLPARKAPRSDGPELAQYPQGKPLTIYGYFPRGPEVWARIFKGYICLFAPNRTDPFPTSWRMETTPPPY